MLVVIGFALASPTVAAGKGKNKNALLMCVIEGIQEDFRKDYPRDIVLDLQNMHTAVTIDGEPFGFRPAGSSAAHQASLYVKDKLENCTGLPFVYLEKIPLDAWEFHGAWVDVPGLGKLQGASHGGSPGTNGEITAEIVDVGNGFASDYEGKNVAGKIVLANWIGADFWVDSIAMEASIHGAKAVVVTTYDSDYGNQPGQIECHDGLYRETGYPPMVSISGVDGLKIIEKINEYKAEGQTLEVTVFSDIDRVLMEDGGFGWNVVGYLPGKNYGKPNDEFVILGDHTDAWFFGGMDDDSGIAATLVLADALKKASDKLGPFDRTVIFTTHDAEEYGILDTYYDWCYGAWYQITKTHPEWVGQSVAYVNFELMGMAGLPLDVNLAPELASFVHNVLGQNNAKLPYGFKVTPVPHSWADHWTFTAAGIPGIELETVNDYWDANYYHSQYDTIDIIDFSYLQQLFEVFSDLTVRLLTQPIVPYNFEVSSTNLLKLLTTSSDFGVKKLYPIYARYDIDPQTNMGRTLSDASKLYSDVLALKAKLETVSADRAHEVNVQLMSIEAVLSQTLIAQGVWEQDWYPYQQSANDVIHLDKGIEILKNLGVKGNDVTDAVHELNWVGIMWYYDYMSKANYLDQASKLTGDDVASWGLQTHLLPAVDLWDEYDYLTKIAHTPGLTTVDLAGTISALEEKMVGQALVELEQSFQTMWMGLENADSQILALTGSL